MRREYAHVHLLLQHNHSSHKSRQRMDLPLGRPWKAANVEPHISGVLEHRVCDLLPPNMLASNCQREEVLAVLLLLVADLDPRPLSNLGNLIASCNLPGTGLVVITTDIPSQDDLWRRDRSTNKCIEPKVNAKCDINLSGVLLLEIFCAFNVVQDLPLRLQLWNCNQLVILIWNLVLLSVKEDQVAPICKRVASSFFTWKSPHGRK